MNSSEITVTLRSDDAKMTYKFLIYEPFNFSSDDPVIQDCVAKAQLAFKQSVTDITLKAVMSL